MSACHQRRTLKCQLSRSNDLIRFTCGSKSNTCHSQIQTFCECQPGHQSIHKVLPTRRYAGYNFLHKTCHLINQVLLAVTALYFQVLSLKSEHDYSKPHNLSSHRLLATTFCVAFLLVDDVIVERNCLVYVEHFSVWVQFR